ncbi:MAG: 50S ribosomal protein L17 [Planctomycetota bacterium]
MRHLKRGRKLGRTSAHRKALRQNLAVALFTHGRIITTMAKAKEYRPFVEKMITLAKKGITARGGTEDVNTDEYRRYLHCYRRAISILQDKAIAKKLFEEIAPGYMDRSGGYTRILKDSKRRLGDNAPRAVWELVEFSATASDEPEKKKGKKKK